MWPKRFRLSQLDTNSTPHTKQEFKPNVGAMHKHSKSLTGPKTFGQKTPPASGLPVSKFSPVGLNTSPKDQHNIKSGDANDTAILTMSEEDLNLSSIGFSVKLNIQTQRTHFFY